MGIDTVILGNGDVTTVEHGTQLAQQTGCDGIMVGRAIFGNPWLFAKTSNENTDSHERNIPSKGTNIFLLKNFSSRPGRPARNLFQVHFFRSLLTTLGIFKPAKNKYWLKVKSAVPVTERLNVMVEHSELFEKLLGDIKNFAIMKKHFKAYVNGFDGAKELRMELMEKGNNAGAVKDIVDKFLSK